MKHYHIITPKAVERLEVMGERIVHATGQLDWAIALEFSHVLGYCRGKGWSVVPMLYEQQPNRIKHKGIVYTFTWSGDDLLHVTKIEDDTETAIAFSDLPDQVKKML